ncbi:MAG: serine hydrolase domain-containing protein [Burkholderiaceae bacterium]
MAELSKNGARIVRVAFPKQGGNRWSVINDKGVYFNRGIPDEAHMMMGFLAGVHGQVRHIAFDGDGSGWSILSDGNKNEKVCDQAGCVSIVEMYRQITKRLDGKVVGCACSLGGAQPTYLSRGQARTSVDGGSRFFAPFTKTTVASVSKFVTALVAIKVLAKNDVSLDDPIGSHLPSDWHLDPVVAAITFRELLSHRSGIKDYGNVSQEYDKVKAFFTQQVDTSKNTPCQGAAVIDPPDAINANDKSPCYSNYNFAIFRILLPWIDGVRDDSAQRASKLAAAFVRLAQQHVFEPVGAIGVQAKPPSPASDQAYSYVFPGSSSGQEWGDGTLGVGAAGWYLSIEDVAKVLHSLNRDDERILTHPQLADMEATSLGWDVTRDGNGLRWVEKNGGWGTGKGSVSTSVALMGPGVYGALFINSNISGEPGVGADAVLHDAFVAAYQKR